MAGSNTGHALDRACTRRSACAGIATLLLGTQVQAQGIDGRPVRLVASSTPGSSVDLAARAMSSAIADSLHATVVVENRPGAGGTVAAAYVLSTGQDGSAVLVNSSAHVSTPAMYPQLAFDVMRDFIGIPVAAFPNVLVVPADRGWTSLPQLVAAAGASKDGLFHGSVGAGSATYMSAELLRQRTKMKSTQVSFKGSPEVGLELAAGRIDWAVLPLSSATGLVKQGRVRAIALAAEGRSALLPEVPTLAEAGWGDADFPLWVALFVPAKASAAVRDRLYAANQKALAQPEVKERLDTLGAVPMRMSLAQFDTLLRRQADTATALIQAAGLKPN